ncbi:Speckle-type POZ protein-like protein [Hordeum vulgare]|uniref:BTB domain-containing protein n=1 Tax=Hordeum vulgare subsp. vulgare TaxID=112509 RepID=A0A8I6XAZ1_HORVV|nr:Speckle-type POZ protein-like protein [Hordeum vulgare]
MASTPLNKTASTHRSTLVRGTHRFHIVGYSERKRNSSVVRSGDFEAGECIWSLSCCFKKQGLASMSLELVSGKYAATAMASVRMDDPLHRWPAAVWRSPDTNTFPALPLPATTSREISRSWKLPVPNKAFFHGQEERYVVDDRLTILCVVHVLRLDLALAKTRSCFVSAVPPPTISGDLLMLLSASLSAKPEESVKPCMMPDVTFIVDQTEIRAHKLVLSVRSPVFAAEFRWHMDESSIIRVVKDMSASTFRAMLRFIYTDELPIKPNNNRMISLTSQDKHASRRYEAMARDLLVAADRYDLQRLRLLCEKVLAEGMDHKSVIPTLMVVHGRYHCGQLEDLCIEYIASHPNVYNALKATEEYNEMKKNSCCCSFLVEVADKVDHVINMAPNYSSSKNLQQSHKRKRNDGLRDPHQVVVHGSHKFTIPYFRAVQRSLLAVGKNTIGSGIFRVGGYNWTLCVRWLDPSNSSSFVVYLCLERNRYETSHVTTSIGFKIDDPSGTSLSPITMVEEIFTKAENFRRAKFTLMKSTNSSHDDSLTVQCYLNVTKEAAACTSSSTISDGAGVTVVVPPSYMGLHLEQLLMSGESSDVRFLVEDCEIRAHGLVIAARSPVLYQVLEAVAAKEGDHHIVRINNMKAAVFRSVLHFIYTDKLPSTDNPVLVIEDMLAAGCRFRLERLKIACENFLADHISNKNALYTLKLAQHHHCLKLEKYCGMFISTKL